MRAPVPLGLALLLLAARAGGEWKAGAPREIPLDGDTRGWVVRATLDGKVSGLFLLDTGASVCVVGPALARRLGADASGRQVELRTANGVVRAPLFHLRTVDVGGSRARDVPAVVHAAVAPPLDGVIGLSFLNQFRYAIDPRRRVLRLN
jgi:clan AA aspartic protease (TIGR02281 family)